jgi:predicted nucleic acid-binding protein
LTDPRPRIYLDTSVLRHLYADDRPDRRDCTWRLWNRCLAGDYLVVISSTVIKELDKAPEAKQKMILEAMSTVAIGTLSESDEVERLADEYVRHGVLSQKSHNDCMHLAYAAVYECDALVSWNFRHLVRTTTADRVRVVNSVNQYPRIAIVSPAILLGEGGLECPLTIQ